MSALALLDSVDLRPQLREDLVSHRTQLEELEKLYDQTFAKLDVSGRKAAIHACILRQGILYEQMRVAWCREAIKVLDTLDPGSALARRKHTGTET